MLSAGDEENPNPDAFEGTMILISHDRALLDATCDHLIVLDGDGNAEIFLGGFTLWHEKSIQRKREADRKAAEEKSRREDNARRQEEAAKKRDAERAPPPSASKSNAPKPSTSKGNPSNAGKGGSAKGAMTVNAIMRLTTDQLEERIEKVETRMREVDALLNDPDVWRDHARATKLGDERAQLAEQLEPLEFEWARRAEDNP